MSVIILLAGRSWTSVQNTDLDDHLANDGCLNGPTYIARDQIPLTQDDFQVNIVDAVLSDKLISVFRD